MLNFDTKHLSFLVTTLTRRIEKLERLLGQLYAETNQQALTWPTRREVEALTRRLESLEQHLPPISS